MAWKSLKINGNKISIKDSMEQSYSFKPISIDTDKEDLNSFVSINNVDFRNNSTIFVCNQEVNKDIVNVNCYVNTPKDIKTNSINITINNVKCYFYVIGMGMITTSKEWLTAIGFKIYENGEYIGCIGSHPPSGWDTNLLFFKPYWTSYLKRSGAYLWDYECYMLREFKKSKNLNVRLEFYTERVNRPSYKILNGLYQVTDNMISYPINHRVITMSKFKKN